MLDTTWAWVEAVVDSIAAGGGVRGDRAQQWSCGLVAEEARPRGQIRIRIRVRLSDLGFVSGCVLCDTDTKMSSWNCVDVSGLSDTVELCGCVWVVGHGKKL